MASDATSGNHVKVTINDLYKEQQETNKLLIQPIQFLWEFNGEIGLGT